MRIYLLLLLLPIWGNLLAKTPPKAKDRLELSAERSFFSPGQGKGWMFSNGYYRTLNNRWSLGGGFHIGQVRAMETGDTIFSVLHDSGDQGFPQAKYFLNNNFSPSSQLGLHAAIQYKLLDLKEYQWWVRLSAQAQQQTATYPFWDGFYQTSTHLTVTLFNPPPRKQYVMGAGISTGLDVYVDEHFFLSPRLSANYYSNSKNIYGFGIGCGVNF